MKSPEVTLSSVAQKWSRIARKIARTENLAEIQDEVIKSQRNRIRELEEELLRVRPLATKWGWLWWTLRRPEVLSVRVNVGTERTVEATRRLINSAMSANWSRLECRVHIHHIDGHVFDISRGGSWREYDEKAFL